jgi:hypothetical protein
LIISGIKNGGKLMTIASVKIAKKEKKLRV